MKKLLGIVVLGLLLNSCSFEGENFGLGKRFDVIKQNENEITLQWIEELASEELRANKAISHCAKYNKRAIPQQLKSKGPVNTLTYKCMSSSISGNKNYVVLFLYGDETDALPYAEKHCAKFKRSAQYKSKEEYKVIFDCVD
jgi:hypothetical protein